MAQPSDALEHDIFIHYHKKVPLFVTTFLPNKEKTPFEEAEPIGRGREFESRFPLPKLKKRLPDHLGGVIDIIDIKYAFPATLWV